VNKQYSGKTILIKINGEQRPFLEEPAKQEPIRTEENDAQTQFIFENEEQHAIIETAATQETEESFDWILPLQDSTQNEKALKKINPTLKHPKGIRIPALSNVEKKNAFSLKSIALSILLAVILGTGFGFAMLKLVVINGSKPAPVTNKAQPAANNHTAVTNNQRSVTAAFEPLTAYMVQGGVFSKQDTAKNIAHGANKEGVPSAIMEWNNQYYIFLGVADSLESARSLGSKLLQVNGINGVFAKAITIPQKKLSNLSTDEKNLIETASGLFPLSANITANSLTGGTISSNEWKSFITLETKLTKIDRNGIKNKKISHLDQEITGAVKQINDYRQKKDLALIEKAQQYLLTFLTDYYTL
jgi:stage II sporulation protein B